jgi:antitoxin HicB
MKDLNYYKKLRYPFVLEQDEDGSYLIQYPDLPGCMSCGKTLEEAIEMGQDAKKCWIETSLDENGFILEPRTVNVM